MTKLTRCGLFLAGMLSLTVVAGCAALKDTVGYPGVSVQGVDVSGLTLSGIKFTFDVEIENTYSADLPVVGFDYQLSTGDLLLVEGDTPVSQTIPAKSSRVVPLTVTVPYGTIMDVKDHVQTGSTVPYHLDMDLKVEAPVIGTVKLPVDYDGEVDIPSI